MENEKKFSYQVIDTESKLKDFAKTLEGEADIAADLEADSMYHFKEKVCLLQMATPKANVIIDPLQVRDLSPLIPFFKRHDIRKILHGADYDIRSLHRDFSIEINNLFDTQIACRFLGYRETGLEAVLQRRFSITLDKKYQRKNWSQRPLPADMMEYAAKDAIYLVSLANALEKELEAKGRVSWVHEECDELTKVRAETSNGNLLCLRFKGAGRLRPRRLGILESLLHFRQDIAEKKDRPVFKILGNDSLLGISKLKPVSLRELERTKTLSRKQVNMYGDGLVECVRTALEIPEKDLPVYPRKKGPVLSPKVPARVNSLKRWRNMKAQELEMDPALICNKLLLTMIAIKNPRDTESLKAVREMKNWQQETFGEEIVDVLKKRG
ncbi:MAG: hypothetical protein B6245_03225 [Desulfobacteraceae bacterium 4572_88]|nr:MAG: hypothetical protein B6245_03225 [Desulfobacteraceae bacterium 4572_88]